VSDNGNGFDENKNTSIGGLGLQSIKNRVKFLDGIIKINSSSSGTGILIKIPLN
jgi:two-component system NarL family sensor kinase